MRTKPLVAVIDDQDAFLEIMEMHLASAGFIPAVFRCETKDEALAYCETVMPDLVLLDIYLAGTPAGLKIAGALKANPKTKNIKVIFWSNATKSFLEEISDTGSEAIAYADNFLDKTEDLPVVTSTIASTLSRK